MDALARKRQLHKARRRRWRARQRKRVRVVNVEVSDRLLWFLIETGRISDAEALADDRGATGPIARAIAQMAEDQVSAFEVREGRISTG